MLEFEQLAPELSTEFNTYNHGRFVEIAQHLADLGYIQITEKENQIVNNQDLRKAINTFRRETLESGLIARQNFIPPIIDPKNPGKSITSEELDFLQKITGLDGEFNLLTVPTKTNTTIYSRIFHYRLKLLGLYHNEVSRPYSQQSQMALNKLKSWFSSCTENHILFLTGNFDDLILKIKNNEQLNSEIIYFKYKEQEFSKNYLIENNTSFTKELRQHSRNKNAFKNFKKIKCCKDLDNELADELANNEYNKFLIRIIQLNQWISGHYLGRIDNNIGNLTFKSFLTIAQSEVEAGNINFKTQLFIGYLSDNYWVINLNYLMQTFTVSRDKEKPNFNTLYTAVNATVKKLSEQQQLQLQENMNRSWKAVNVEMSNNLRSRYFRYRRLYSGTAHMIRAFLKNIHGFLLKISQNTLLALDGLKNKIMNFAKLIYREIREGIHHFLRGYKFLFGNRAINTNTVNSKFNANFDVVSCYTTRSDKQSLLEHHEKLQTATNNLSFSMRITADVIVLIIQASTGNYPMLMLKIGKIYKTEVDAYFKKISSHVIST